MEEIVELRKGTDIVAFIEGCGTPLRQVPERRPFVGTCPFCKAPNFHVSQHRGFFHCFDCKESGTVIDFVMKAKGLGFQDALDVLKESRVPPSGRRTKGEEK